MAANETKPKETLKEDASAKEDAPVTLDALIGPLSALPEEERSFGAASLLEFSDLMKKVQVALLTRNVETEELADQDR